MEKSKDQEEIETKIRKQNRKKQKTGSSYTASG